MFQDLTEQKFGRLIVIEQAVPVDSLNLISKRVFTKDLIPTIDALLNTGMRYADVAKDLEVSQAGLRTFVKKNNIKPIVKPRHKNKKDYPIIECKNTNCDVKFQTTSKRPHQVFCSRKCSLTNITVVAEEKVCINSACLKTFVDKYHSDKKYCSIQCSTSCENRNKKISETLKAGDQAATMLGRKLSEETKAKMSASHKGKEVSDTHKANLSKALTGRILSEEHRGKISKNKKGKKYDKPFASKGRKLSAEHKQKIKEGLLRNPNLGKLNKGRKISDETRRKLSEAHKGEKCHFWKHGKSKELKKRYHDVEYNIWRRHVFERDNYTCKICNLRGSYLNAHHIKLFSKFPDDRYVVSNGVTLCQSCHNELHKRNRGKDIIEVLV